MKTKASKRLLSLFLALMLIIPNVFALSIRATEEVQETEETTEATAEVETTSEGVSFNSSKTYTLPSDFKTAPLTFEAVINVPKGTGRAGVIMGNYSDNIDTICFEIYENGNPRIYFKENGVLTDYKFSVDIRSDDYVHLAIVINPSEKTATCYVNGSVAIVGEKEAVWTNNNLENYADYTPANPYMIGGDCRSGNAQYFKGKIKNVVLYSDIRTETEIANDAKNNMNDLASADLSEMLAGYDITKGIPDGLTDISGNGRNLNYSDPEYDEQLLAAGFTFESTDSYRMGKCLKEGDYPTTFETTLFLPKSVADRGGSILGNYKQDTHSMTFEIFSGGQPRVFLCSSDSTAIMDLTFGQVDIRTGTWVNLAITLDFVEGIATCYVNGVAAQQLSIPGSIIASNVYSTELYLGRDTRADRYFKGALKDLTLYSDIRTADEIASDVSGADLTDENIIAAYTFLEETGRSDITGNGYSFYADGETIPDEGGDDSGEGGETGGDEGNTGSGITELDGLTFTSKDYAILQKTFKDNAPYTFEATILVPTTQTERAGIILGNHNSNSYKYLSFEIYSNGVPRLCFTNPSNANDANTFNYLFENVHVNTGEVLHLAITLDPSTGAARCYVDGQLKQTVTKKEFAFGNDFFENYAFVLGNDPRSNNAGAQCFKGTIGNVTVYSDTRTSDEIAADYQGINLNNDNLLLYYDLSSATAGNDIVDLTGNGFDAVFKTRGFADLKSWISDKEPVTDYLYSFAVVGDTQIIAQNHSSSFHMIYDWILDNQTNKKIQYVFGLGDITNGSSSAEWSVASQNIFRLNGVIPHSAIRGNHDTVSSYNNIFVNNSDYMSQFDGFYADGDATSTYRAITIGGIDYLMVTLDYGASDSVLNWASDIIKKYPNHKVIVTTHAYLYRDGTTLDENDVCPPTATNGGYNNGDHIWDKLISQHENIFMVISGHDPSADVVVTQATGVHGNLITQMLVDPQGVDTSTPTGMVTMLYFKADGRIEVETYSTIQELYYKETNQFTLSETEHNYTDTALSYEDGYMQNGALTATCLNCDTTHVFTVNPLFTFSGYSISTFNNSSICVGYTFDFELLSKYETLNDTAIELGFTASPYDYLETEGCPINSDGTSTKITQGVIVNEKLSRTYPHVDLILRSSDWTLYANHKTILCAYIIENGKVGYLCDTETVKDKASYITYSQFTGTNN